MWILIFSIHNGQIYVQVYICTYGNHHNYVQESPYKYVHVHMYIVYEVGVHMDTVYEMFMWIPYM